MSRYNPRESDGPSYKQEKIIYLLNNDGKEVGYIDRAAIKHNGRIYAVLELAQSCYGYRQGQLVIFQVYRGSQGEDCFSLVTDKNLFSQLYHRYCIGDCVYAD